MRVPPGWQEWCGGIEPRGTLRFQPADLKGGGSLLGGGGRNHFQGSPNQLSVLS
jgi:hypothetical protein